MTMKTYKLESGDAFHAATALVDSQRAVLSAIDAIAAEGKARMESLLASHNDASRRLWGRILQPFGIDGAKVFEFGGAAVDPMYREHGVIFIRYDDTPPAADSTVAKAAPASTAMN